MTPSWLEAANDPEGEFPLDNLPFGAFSRDGAPRLGLALGDRIVDVTGLAKAGVLRRDADAFGAATWNAFMARGPEAWSGFRATVQAALAHGSDRRGEVERHLLRMSEAELHLPLAVAEFTDFYAGRHHAENVGTMFRGPDAALPPNWLHMPIGYNGRASSVVVSGTPVRRPWGQIREGSGPPRLAPSERFDFELELGAVVGQPSSGPLTVARAEAMIFGYVLLNDWSARDHQAWEYQPLGPFQSKAAATTVSPWIVPAAALAPFRAHAPARERPLLPYLRDAGPMHLDLELSVTLAAEGGEPVTVARTNARELYWSAAQQLAHHAVSGCPMRVGDLLGSGTVSGPERGARGSLLELSWNGTEPLALPGGATRSFLEDGDTLTLHGHARGDGHRIGFGPCAGTVLPAAPRPDGDPSAPDRSAPDHSLPDHPAQE
jgi:fumarylacetoacetase